MDHAGPSAGAQHHRRRTGRWTSRSLASLRRRRRGLRGHPPWRRSVVLRWRGSENRDPALEPGQLRRSARQRGARAGRWHHSRGRPPLQAHRGGGARAYGWYRLRIGPGPRHPPAAIGRPCGAARGAARQGTGDRTVHRGQQPCGDHRTGAGVHTRHADGTGAGSAAGLPARRLQSVAPLFRAHPQHTASPDLAQQVREQVVYTVFGGPGHKAPPA